jgi:hypothetical protein
MYAGTDADAKQIEIARNETQVGWDRIPFFVDHPASGGLTRHLLFLPWLSDFSFPKIDTYSAIGEEGWLTRDTRLNINPDLKL